MRTDFTDDDAWDQVRDESTREYGPDGFRAYVEPVSDPQWAGATWEALKAAAPVDDQGPCVLFVADSITFASPPSIRSWSWTSMTRSFPWRSSPRSRAGPRSAASRPSYGVDNNLSISNMDWDEFAGAVDDDGAFRGFELPPPAPGEAG